VGDFQITAIDVTILLAYVLGTRLFFGWYCARRMRAGAEGYFLGGRRIGWAMIGLSFYVSNMSGSTFVGLPGSGYHDGVAVYNYEWLASLILIFFILFLLPFYLKARVFTAPQFLATRFNSTTKYFFSAFLLLANIFIDAAAALYAGAIVAQVLFPDLPMWVTISVTAGLAGLYIFFGGLDAVVINDAIQAVLIFIGGVVIAILAWHQIPSWEIVRDAAPDHALHLMRPPDDDFLPWPGVFTGVLIVGIYFWCTNQFVIQRALGARNLDHARWGALFAGLLKLPNLFILVLPGVLAVAMFPDLERADLVFPKLAFELLPVGLRGLMLAALAAAILSSLEAIFNSASTLFTMDFVHSLRPQASDRALANIGRVSTIGFMVLSALWAPVILNFPTLWDYLQSVLSYITPPVVAVFLAGIFWPRANHQGANATLAIGVPLGAVAWLTVELGGLVSIQFLYACGILFLLSLLLIVAVSLATAAPEGEKTRDYTWRMPLWHAETKALSGVPFYKNYRVLAAALAVLTLAIVAWWL